MQGRVAVLVGGFALAVLLTRSGPFSRERVLVTGGNGYLAQHLLAAIAKNDRHTAAYTVRSAAKGLIGSDAKHYTVNDLAQDRYGLEKAIRDLQPSVVVHAAALSSPKRCEADSEAAVRTNAPYLLLDVLAEHAPTALIVYISTDQVYDGATGHLPYRDTQIAAPRNAYGRSKLEFEAMLRRRWPRHLVLRSSNMVGASAPYTHEGKFAQWVAKKLLRENGTVSLFGDEFRSFVPVDDVIGAILAAIDHPRLSWPMTLNCGGRERLSRAALGRLVAHACHADPARVVPSPAAAVDMGYASPPDLAMDSSGLARLGYTQAPSVLPALEMTCAELR